MGISNKGFLFLAAIPLILLGINGFLLADWQSDIAAEEQAAEEAAKPAEMTVTRLSASSCSDCFDSAQLVNALTSNTKIKINKDENVEYDSEQGKALVQKYNLARIPAVVLDGDLEKALQLAPFLGNVGKTIENTFVVDNLPPPYLEVSSGNIRGRYTLTYLTAQNCKECYDVKAHRQVLESLGAKPSEEQTIDRSDREGKKLIADYNIEKLPTIILKGDIAEYAAFRQVWPAVGTAEKDNTYVFRATELMGAYLDLKTGKVVTPAAQAETEAAAINQ